MPEVDTETPPVAEEVKKPKYGPGIPDDFDPEQYKILNPDTFTVADMVLNNKVRADVQLNSNLSATYRSLTMQEIQDIEKTMEYGQARYTFNELHLKPTICSLEKVAMGGKEIKLPEAITDRDKLLRSLPYELMNELVTGYVWFHAKTMLLIRGGDLGKR